MARIIGLVFSGMAVRLGGAVAAIWVAHLGYTTLVSSLNQVSNALTLVQ